LIWASTLSQTTSSPGSSCPSPAPPQWPAQPHLAVTAPSPTAWNRPLVRTAPAHLTSRQYRRGTHGQSTIAVFRREWQVTARAYGSQTSTALDILQEYESTLQVRSSLYLYLYIYRESCDNTGGGQAYPATNGSQTSTALAILQEYESTLQVRSSLSIGICIYIYI